MNIDRGKESFSPEEIRELQQRTMALKATESLSWSALSKRVGISQGTISQWAPGKYSGDDAAVAYEVNKFFLADEERQAMEISAPIAPDFQYTPTAIEIISLLRWAQRGKIVVITGEAGVGKTAAITQYHTLTPQVIWATMSEGTVSPTAMLVEVLRAIGVNGYRAGGMGGVQSLSYMIMDRIAGTRSLIVLDEAQYLSDRALNQLRFIHDKCGVGLALVGNVEVMRRIRGGSSGPAPFAQLHSRVSIPQHFAKPKPDDTAMLLNAWGVQHPAERAFLQKIAEQPGCLRQLTMTLEAATLVATRQDDGRTLSHLQAAWTQQARQPVAA